MSKNVLQMALQQHCHRARRCNLGETSMAALQIERTCLCAQRSARSLRSFRDFQRSYQQKGPLKAHGTGQVALVTGTVDKQLEAKEMGWKLEANGGANSKSSSFQGVNWLVRPGGGPTGEGKGSMFGDISRKFISSSVDGVVSPHSLAKRSERLALRRSWDKWQKVQL